MGPCPGFGLAPEARQFISRGIVTVSTALPASVDATVELLAGQNYLADRTLATTVFLALRLGRPLFLEGEAGVGKTEIAKVLSGRPGPPDGAPAML